MVTSHLSFHLCLLLQYCLLLPWKLGTIIQHLMNMSVQFRLDWLRNRSVHSVLVTVHVLPDVFNSVFKSEKSNTTSLSVKRKYCNLFDSTWNTHLLIKEPLWKEIPRMGYVWLGRVGEAIIMLFSEWGDGGNNYTEKDCSSRVVMGVL